MRLYEISSAIQTVLDGGLIFDEETGEILFDSSDINSLEMALDDKLESCGLFVKNLRAEAEAIKSEEKILHERRGVIERKIARMEDYILDCMERVDKKRIDTPKIALSRRKSSQVIITVDDKIPDKFIKIEEKRSVMKSEIRKALKSGDKVPGAAIFESENLIIK